MGTTSDDRCDMIVKIVDQVIADTHHLYSQEMRARLRRQALEDIRAIASTNVTS